MVLPGIYSAMISDARGGHCCSASPARIPEGAAMALEQAVEYAMAAPIPEMAPKRDPSAPLEDTAAQKYGGLTEREGQVAQLVAQGMSNREIATELVVSERTVEKHVGNILSKLNFHSRTQIGVWVSKISERKKQL